MIYLLYSSVPQLDKSELFMSPVSDLNECLSKQAAYLGKAL